MQLRRVRVISRWAREDWLKSKLRLSENNMQSTLERHASFHTRQRIVMPLFCFLRALGQALCIAPNNAHIELVQCLPVARCRLLALQNLQICRNCNARRILLDGEQRSALCVHGCSVTLQVLWKLLFSLQLCRSTNNCCRTWYDEAYYLFIWPLHRNHPVICSERHLDVKAPLVGQLLVWRMTSGLLTCMVS